jgi:hypothetical protein
MRLLPGNITVQKGLSPLEGQAAPQIAVVLPAAFLVSDCLFSAPLIVRAIEYCITGRKDFKYRCLVREVNLCRTTCFIAGPAKKIRI